VRFFLYNSLKRLLTPQLELNTLLQEIFIIMRHFAFKVSLALIVSCISVVFIYLLPASSAQDNNRQSQQAQKIERGPGKRMAEDKAGIQRLKNKTNKEAEVKTSEATGATRFVNFGKGKKGDLSGLGRSINAKDKSIAFFNEYGSLFGINNDKVEMRLDDEKVDGQGNKHQTFKQFYKGVPVFAGVLKTHFDKEEQLNTVNGNAVPEIELDTTPVIDGQNAAATATTLVAEQKGTQELTAKSITLYVFRTGLVEGVSGDDYLAYEVEVTNGSDIREFVYVDAHSGKIVDQFTGIHDALDRRAYNGNGGNEAQTNAIYAGLPFWKEGDPFPTGNAAADNILTASKETYDLFYNAFNRDSFDGLGKKMDSIFNVGFSCPNAFWNGNFIGTCAGWTTDDMTGHEWTHAHTGYTHNLIYQYQPGALNEAYSDIFGETIDRINSRDDIGNSELDPARTTDSCSIHTPPVGKLVVNSPAALAGTYPAQKATFGPALTSPLTKDVVAAIDALETAAGSTTNDGCSPITNAAAVNGKIALVYRGVCGFSVKVYNAQLAGAVGVIVANNISGHFAMPAGPNSNLVTIPSLSITKAVGDNIVANLANTTVNTTLQVTAGTDASSRWLFGEDVASIGLTGALRDMYNPTCKSHPGKVSDTAFYNCEIHIPGNNAAVHTNSGVPNHAFALLVDGGTYNGQTINAIGLTKAIHIYYRAMSLYQVQTSNFIDHADSLEQSAADFIASGTNLPNLKTGLPSGEIFTQSDLEQVKKAMLAVEMRKVPCGTNSKRPPADFDGDGKTDVSVFRPNGGNWFITNSSNNAFRGEGFGAAGDVITPGDYDGDGKTDLAVFRAGNWYINGSQTGFRGVQFGIATDKPVAADYDGDGKADIAVYRGGAWYISNSSNGQFRGINWGLATDLPVAGDYDNDGKADVAVFRPSNGTWYALKSSDGGLIAAQFGAAGDKPVPGDYDADGKNDFAVFRPSAGSWYVLQTTAGFRGINWGIASDVPVPGDYDGDGKTDFAVYRGGNWYISLNANNQFRATNFGLTDDVPAPAGYIPLQ
jgi:Zn-dependent metalloprotease